MIKKTLYFGNPCFVRKKNNQLAIEGIANETVTIPIEDIGVVMIDNNQIQLTSSLISDLINNNVVIVICDEKHLPSGMLMPMFSHHAFTEKMYQQIESSVPLKKNLWQQTIIAKINNQAALLSELGISDSKLKYYSRNVKSGDSDNCEGRAAAYYWDKIFGVDSNFTRAREGDSPNNLLNYGYAILLAIVARGIVGSGLLPAMGIHHRNKYNPWCLASDLMEPYRPFVDRIVINILEEEENVEYLVPSLKKKLLQIPVIDVYMDGKSSPLMVAIQRTTSSLSNCFEGSSRKLLYPELKLS